MLLWARIQPGSKLNYLEWIIILLSLSKLKIEFLVIVCFRRVERGKKIWLIWWSICPCICFVNNFWCSRPLVCKEEYTYTTVLLCWGYLSTLLVKKKKVWCLRHEEWEREREKKRIFCKEHFFFDILVDTLAKFIWHISRI